MNQSYPVPPPELLDQWCMENNWRDIAIQAAQWGADQELEACCELLDELPYDGPMLYDARRPKPPSLKEQALLVIDTAVNDYRMSSDAASIIRRALEALND